METLIKFRNTIIAWKYRFLLKPILFRHNPEEVHDRFNEIGKFLGQFQITRFIVRLCFGYSHPTLEQNILGIKFKNPVGLSAGFDKNIELADILPFVGFGFMEGGSVTGEPCEGNPKPRLWRLPKSKSLLVYYGLKNDGAKVISHRLKVKKFAFPVGVSLAKTNSKKTIETDAGVADYLSAYRYFLAAKVGDYYTINISCPNTFGGEPFANPSSLKKLLTALATEHSPIATWSKPIFIKLPPDNLPANKLDEIIELGKEYNISGFICSNLVKDKTNKNIQAKIKETLPAENGGLSGKAVEDLANQQISYLYKKAGDRFIIIGVGGIFNATDAYKKIKAGASLLQMITGMIFNGPQTISQINQGLVKLLQQDGYHNISQAIGKET
ncbi:MAG: quinone-dependent dihydroorotate dehydrogenase [Candidatus Paceibacterota bacterium]